MCNIYSQKMVLDFSVFDDVDTLDRITNLSSGAATGLRIPLVNIFNQEYAADISPQTQASIDRNIHDGKCAVARALYKHAKSISDCHQLVVAPEMMLWSKKYLQWQKKS